MKKLFLLCFIISSVIFTSCLKIEEYISINNEGIGSYKIKLDLANIAMFHQLMNSPTDRLAEEIQYYIDKIRAVKGISNVNFLHSENT